MVRASGAAWDGPTTKVSRDAMRTLVLLGCYVLVVAVVISHQLTPGILASATLLFVVSNATRLRVLPVFIAVVFLAWLSFGASTYWFGHFDALTGSVGKVGNLVTPERQQPNRIQAVGRRPWSGPASVWPC